MHTLILGIGNTLLADDGAGVHAVRAMRGQLSNRDDIALLDGGTLSFSLLPDIERAARLIVLDATQMNGEPGSVHCFEGAELDGLLTRPRRSVHEVSLLDLLTSARLMGALPRCRALVGVQPASIDWSDSLSETVRAAVPWMIEVALERHAAWVGAARSGAAQAQSATATVGETPERAGHGVA